MILICITQCVKMKSVFKKQFPSLTHKDLTILFRLSIKWGKRGVSVENITQAYSEWVAKNPNKEIEAFTEYYENLYQEVKWSSDWDFID